MKTNKRVGRIAQCCSLSLGLLFLGGTGSTSAQNGVVAVLSSVEQNNTTLKALRESAEAQKLENRTGIYLANPEVEFNRLWGSPGAIGNRTDVSVTQSFDIPTVTGMKSRIAEGRNDMVEWQYKSDRLQILLDAKLDCIELIYYNALKKELDMRLDHAQALAGAYKEKLEQGDVNILEYNKAQLNLATVQGEMSRVDVERNALLQNLKRLNGGIAVLLEDAQYGEQAFPLHFDEWYAGAEQKNPVLAYVRQEVEVSRKQVNLSKAMGLPVFSAGYMSEKIVGEHYQGITLGVSIPLWENKNKVRQAKAAVRAAEFRETDSKQQFYSRLQTQYEQATGLKAVAAAYRKSIETLNSTALLKKALDAGEISLLDYIVEIGLYYETINRTLEAERDFQKSFAGLSAVEL
ncbi:MAG: TolC family protein [Tannerella sp.]|jgi:outer membrane protein TolC|nr:TolC family protein [Tannerella sp.]